MLTRIFCVLVLTMLGANAGITKGSKDLGAIWFIGDSITQSNADGDPAGSPRKALYDLLGAAGYQFTFTGHHTANPDGLPDSGATPADNLYHYHSGISGSVIGADVSGRAGMTQRMPAFWSGGRLAAVKPSIIIIMVGTNDTCMDLACNTAPERLAALVDAILVQPDAGKPTILISSIPPDRVPDKKPAARVAAYNAAIPGIVKKFRARGVDAHFVDIFRPLDVAYDKTMDLDPDPERTRYDHLHPGKHGNEVMAKQWFAKIRELAGG